VFGTTVTTEAVFVQRRTGLLLRESEKDLILASDRDSGLWIFRYTGPR
jgi:hypothetical protein